MATNEGPIHNWRIRPESKKDIAAAKQIRSEASALRERVSSGSYDDRDLEIFLRLVGEAGIALNAPNPYLSQRGGLGNDFFSSVARDRRRPKLTNFLRALSAIIEVADERLHDIERYPSLSVAGQRRTDLSSEYSNLAAMAVSLREMAATELERATSERPNDPASIALRDKQVEFLTTLVEGLDRLSQALLEISVPNPEPMLIGKAQTVVSAVAKHIEKWCSNNASEVAGWGARASFFTLGVALLNMAGAYMPAATPAMAVIVGAKKIDSIIKRKKSTK